MSWDPEQDVPRLEYWDTDVSILPEYQLAGGDYFWFFTLLIAGICPGNIVTKVSASKML